MPRFEKGKSGNPKGRPKGAINKKNFLIESFLEYQDFEEIMLSLISQAKEGCVQSQNLLISRVRPPWRPVDKPVHFRTGESLADSAMLILKAMGKGEVPVNLGCQILNSLASTAKVLELAELEKRLEALENGSENKFREVA